MPEYNYGEPMEEYAKKRKGESRDIYRIRRFGSGGAKAFPNPSFDLPFADLGGGVVSLVSNPAFSIVPATFTRATTAWTKMASGLWGPVGSGSARYTYAGLTTAATTTGGYLPEGSRTNSGLQARDMTNAAWTKTTMTTAQTSTGIDGVANSCTRCTASAGNATSLQAVTLASAAKSYGVWLKRITGTGEIDITLDNGSTWTNVTASINSATFTLVQATQTLANPTIGIRIVTNGDAVDVDMSQLEDAAAFTSTPIPTVGATVTRNADVLTYPVTWYNQSQGTFFVATTPLQVVATTALLSVNDGTSNERIRLLQNTNPQVNMQVNDGGVLQASFSAGSLVTGTMYKAAAAYKLNDFAMSVSGGAVQTAVSGTLPTITALEIGADLAVNQPYGPISRVSYFGERLSNAQLQAMTA